MPAGKRIVRHQAASATLLVSFPVLHDRLKRVTKRILAGRIGGGLPIGRPLRRRFGAAPLSGLDPQEGLPHRIGRWRLTIAAAVATRHGDFPAVSFVTPRARRDTGRMPTRSPCRLP